MSNPTIQMNLNPNDTSLSDLLNLLRREIFLDLNCHHLAKVESVNLTAQTLTASMNYPKTLFQLNETTQTYSPVQVDYPLLVDIPFIVLGGGGAWLTFPIAKGDQVLVLFNDRSIDNWFQSGQVGPVSSPRAHSFSDGIALVGLNHSAAPITNYDSSRAVLRGPSGTAGVGVSSSLVKIFNATTTLNTILQNILTQLENLATACTLITVTGVTTGPGVSGVPANAATFTAISTQLTTLASDLGGLLE